MSDVQRKSPVFCRCGLIHSAAQEQAERERRAEYGRLQALQAQQQFNAYAFGQGAVLGTMMGPMIPWQQAIPQGQLIPDPFRPRPNVLP